MQRYFIDRNQIKENIVVIDGQDVHHIKDVMRNKLNDKLILNTYDGSLYLSTITSIDKKSIVLEIIEEIKSDWKPLNLDLGISLIKKDNFELILQKVTELGVNMVIPLKTQRSIIKLDDFSKKKLRYQTILKEASEQSERTMIPEIADYLNLEDLKNLNYDHKYFCYAREENNNIKCILEPFNANESTLVLIGPEGGFSDEEIKSLEKSGFTSISLGKTILRAETAAIYVASIFRYLTEE
ncbi:MAG: 16S rRNA (uracil(1498)-N(3))-methyltransferase [Candidatus Izemoplasmatales bacterium]